MKCEGLHCPGCRGGGESLAVLISLAVLALAAWLVWTHELAAGLIVGGAVVITVAGGIWMNRRGSEVALVSYQALPAPERRELAGQPVRVLPPVQPPQQITNNFYGYRLDEVARAVAEQHAINEGK